MDDIFLASEIIEHHLEVLQQIFKLLVNNLISLRINKCRFLQKEIEYLGYKVSEKGISPTNSRVEATFSYRKAFAIYTFLDYVNTSENSLKIIP